MSSDAKELKGGHPPAGTKFFINFDVVRWQLTIFDLFMFWTILHNCIFLVKAGGMRIASKAHPHTHHNLTPEQKLEDKKFMEEEHIMENCEEKYDWCRISVFPSAIDCARTLIYVNIHHLH